MPPAPPVGTNTNAAFWNGPTIAVQVTTPVDANEREALSWKSLAQTLRHPDVFLPLIAAALVLLVLLAWAS